MCIHMFAARHAFLATSVISSPVLHRVMGLKMHAILSPECVFSFGAKVANKEVIKQEGMGERPMSLPTQLFSCGKGPYSPFVSP